MRNSFIFILWRIILFIPLIIGFYLIPYRSGQYFTNILNQANPTFYGGSLLVLPWANFDGIHYLNIAEHGYTNQARFFPLFPLIIKVIYGSLIADLILVTIIFFLALWLFKKLVVLDFSSQIATKSLINLLLFPTSFFFVCIYSEGLFLLLILLAFYFARRKRWILATLCGILVMATRFVGIAVLPALLYEFLTNEKVSIKKLVLFLITPLGLVLYALFNYYKWHNFFYFIQAQGELGNNRSVASIVLFPQTIFRYFKILSTVPVSSYGWGIALLELTAFVFVSILLYFAWKKKVRTSYLIFALINFAIAISTGTFSGLPRYIITIFPIFIALALIKNRVIRYSYMIISPILLFILLMLFSRGYFVA